MTVAPRRLATPSSVNAAIKQIADVMRRANCAGALQIKLKGREVDAAIAQLRLLLNGDETGQIRIPEARVPSADPACQRANHV